LPRFNGGSTHGRLFKTKTDIMAKQAKTYKYVDVEDGNKEYEMDPELCMGENLADLGGLSLSLNALKKSLIATNASAGVVKAAVRASFKAWATIWKLNIKKDSRLQRLTTDPHAPCDFRANLVNNMDEFYDAFGIKESDPMYIAPADRLRMW
jgi:predicted metalloendopeptidase